MCATSCCCRVCRSRSIPSRSRSARNSGGDASDASDSSDSSDVPGSSTGIGAASAAPSGAAAPTRPIRFDSVWSKVSAGYEGGGHHTILHWHNLCR